ALEADDVGGVRRRSDRLEAAKVVEGDDRRQPGRPRPGEVRLAPYGRAEDEEAEDGQLGGEWDRMDGDERNASGEEGDQAAEPHRVHPPCAQPYLRRRLNRGGGPHGADHRPAGGVEAARYNPRPCASRSPSSAPATSG